MNKTKLISISLFLAISLWLNTNASFSTTYSDEIKIEKEAKETNTQENIKKAKLLKNLINKYRIKLENYKETLDLNNDSILEKSIEQLIMMENALNKISTTDVSKETADSVIWSIIKNLKEFTTKTNNHLKPIITKHLKEVNNYKDKYSKNLKKLEIIVWKIEKKFKIYFEKTPKISTIKKNAINQRVENMKNYAENFQEFYSKDFETSEDIKDLYNNYKKQIINEYIAIVKILK